MTPQLELNKKLYNACIEDIVDYDLVESLLKEGASPLGLYTEDEYSTLVYDDIFQFYWLSEKEYVFCELSELFVKNGMDIHSPDVPYDEFEIRHPFDFLFFMHKEGTKIIKLFLDNGADAYDAAQCWGHFTFDFLNLDLELDGEDSQMDNFVDGLKKMFLIASYPHILNDDEDLREFIWCDQNNYTPCNFRNWEYFSYQVDTSECKGYPQAYRSIITIIDDRTQEKVWQFQFGTKKRKVRHLKQT